MKKSCKFVVVALAIVSAGLYFYTSFVSFRETECETFTGSMLDSCYDNLPC